MTINKYDGLNRPSSSTNPSGFRHHLPATMADICPVQQGVVDMCSSLAVAARIIPLDDQGEPGPKSQVELNSCDGRGISFHHQLPLSARRALISVDDEDFGRLDAEVILSWCRFNRMGHYTSGGSFVQPAGRIA